MKIGNDIVRISRMKDIYTNQHLMDRLFDNTEQQYINTATDMTLRYERMAGKIALKEAVAKAFGVGIADELSWKDIITSHDILGKPTIVIGSNLQKLLTKYDLTCIDASISHMDDYATAVCIIY